MTVSAHDVAAYILERRGSMSTMKLQKLVYYSQAWHLVWDEEPLFTEAIEAWANGPVVYELFDVHRGHFTVDSWPRGDRNNLADNERETVDVVLDGYGDLDGRKLSALTHGEGPWLDARDGLRPTESSSKEITCDALQIYYTGVQEAAEAVAVDDVNWRDWESADPADVI